MRSMLAPSQRRSMLWAAYQPELSLPPSDPARLMLRWARTVLSPWEMPSA